MNEEIVTNNILRLENSLWRFFCHLYEVHTMNYWSFLFYRTNFDSFGLDLDADLFCTLQFFRTASSAPFSFFFALDFCWNMHVLYVWILFFSIPVMRFKAIQLSVIGNIEMWTQARIYRSYIIQCRTFDFNRFMPIFLDFISNAIAHRISSSIEFFFHSALHGFR